MTDDRTALNLEVSSLQETVSRLEGRIKEREEEAKRYGSYYSSILWNCNITML